MGGSSQSMGITSYTTISDTLLDARVCRLGVGEKVGSYQGVIEEEEIESIMYR